MLTPWVRDRRRQERKRILKEDAGKRKESREEERDGQRKKAKKKERDSKEKELGRRKMQQ